MTVFENHFCLRFLPFQIKAQLFSNFFSTKWPTAAILDTQKPLSFAFLAIFHKKQLLYFLIFFVQNGRRQSFLTPENHFRSRFSPFQIKTQLFYFGFFLQNGRRRPFWMLDFHQKRLSVLSIYCLYSVYIVCTRYILSVLSIHVYCLYSVYSVCTQYILFVLRI